MNYLAGVDEAGLGPILGPLVVAGVAMEGAAGGDPWTQLADQVCRQRAEKGKVRVADSKKVFTRGQGLAKLEQTVLTFWGAWRGSLPATLRDLMPATQAARLEACPWYGELDLALPLDADRGLLELKVHALTRALEREGMRILHLTALPVDAKEFNELIEATDNKSHAHFDAYSRVIGELLEILPNGGHLVADRCGGLMHYLPALRRAYPGASIRKLQERVELSSYAITRGEQRAKVSFAAGGEDRAFPTALASCIAKYVREAMLHLLNGWFRTKLPELRPTAGYYTDGRRFLKEAAPIVDSPNFPRSMLVRSR